jgi:hypothetical protein
MTFEELERQGGLERPEQWALWWERHVCCFDRSSRESQTELFRGGNGDYWHAALSSISAFLVSPQGFGTEQGFPKNSFSHQEPILAPPSIRAVISLRPPTVSSVLRKDSGQSKDFQRTLSLIRTNPCSALNPCGDFLATSHCFLGSPQGFGTEQGFPKNSFSRQVPILAPPSIRAVISLQPATVSSVPRKDSGRSKDFQRTLSLVRNQSLLRPQSVR